jgi:hypothetical protein
MRTPSNRSCLGLAVAIAGCCGLFTTGVWAVDWPQYLGPARNSTSPEK